MSFRPVNWSMVELGGTKKFHLHASAWILTSTLTCVVMHAVLLAGIVQPCLKIQQRAYCLKCFTAGTCIIGDCTPRIRPAGATRN